MKNLSKEDILSKKRKGMVCGGGTNYTAVKYPEALDAMEQYSNLKLEEYKNKIEKDIIKLMYPDDVEDDKKKIINGAYRLVLSKLKR